MKTLEECKIPDHFIMYAINKGDSITDDERQICLDNMDTALDYHLFSKHVKGLSFKQKWFCKDKHKVGITSYDLILIGTSILAGILIHLYLK